MSTEVSAFGAASAVRASPRLEFVDGLRGVAILLVVLRHYYMSTYQDGYPRAADALGLGYVGVHLFLLLSGFCIAAAYVGPRPRPFDAPDFFKRRAQRILPAYYVALAVGIVLSLPMGGGTFLYQSVTHALMLHNLFPSTVLALNGAFWSLALECQFYLMFPLLLRGFQSWGGPKTMALVFIMQMAFRLFALRLGTGYNEWTFILPWGMPGRLFEFTMGMAIAVLVARHPAGGSAILPDRLRFALLPVTLISFAAAWYVKGKWGVSHPLTDLLWSTGFALLFLLAHEERGVIAAAMRWRPLVSLGIMSYSVYLAHGFLISPVTRMIHALTGGRFALLTLPFGVLLVFALCSLFYYAVEKPGVDYFARRRAARRARLAPLPALPQ